MNKFAFLVSAFIAAKVFAAAPVLELGISNQDTGLEAEAAGEKSISERRGEVFFAGIQSPITEDFAFGLRLGYGEVGSESKHIDRVLKILPKYTFLRLNEAGGFYATAGIAAHSFLLRKVETSIYTGAAGLGFQNDLNAANFKLGLEMLYEQSFKSADYTIGGTGVKNQKLRNLEATFSLGFKL